MYMVVYQKQNGEIFNRIRNTLPGYVKGETTSMGWKIVEIKYQFYDGKYYTSRELREKRAKLKEKNKFSRKVFCFLHKKST